MATKKLLVTSHAPLLAIPFALLAVGCSTGRSSQDVQAQRDQVVCSREVQVGSMMPQRRCRTVDQILKEREDAQKSLNFVRQNPGEFD
jgi:hypothetical protein